MCIYVYKRSKVLRSTAWVVFAFGLVWPLLRHIQSGYGDLLCKSLYSVQMREKIRTIKNPNTDILIPLYYIILIPLYCKFYSYKLAEWLWRHETSSSNSRCFVSLIPEYNRSISICWALFSEEVYYIFLLYLLIVFIR